MKEKIQNAWAVFCAKITGLLLLAAFFFGGLSIVGIIEQIMLKNGKGFFFCIMSAAICASIIIYLYMTGAVERARKIEIEDCEGAKLG